MEKYIVNCLNSVANQLYDDIECIIVDDCSPDNSMIHVASFLEQYEGKIIFKIVTHEKNQGLSAARNSGVKIATGDYLFFLDSDDELSLNALELFASYLKEYGNVDFLIGNFEVLGRLHYSSLQAEFFLDSTDEILEAYIHGKWHVMAWAKLINHDFFLKENLWFKDGLLHEDELFSFRLAVSASRMVSIKESVYRYFIRNNSIMSNKKGKNYWDYLWIVAENVKLAYKQIPESFYPLLYSYFVSLLYTHSFSILNESNLRIEEKKKMMEEVKDLLSVIQDMAQDESTKIRLKRKVLRAPYQIIFIETRIHRWIQKFFNKKG